MTRLLAKVLFIYLFINLLTLGFPMPGSARSWQSQESEFDLKPRQLCASLAAARFAKTTCQPFE
ncbi:hypothetical protein, partial [Klebsiella pneumoniae]|uniref:hypothetical protein n=1 Tax=Klebsiella pneumoniae TaxID=573 RepID=UPI003012C9AA